MKPIAQPLELCQLRQFTTTITMSLTDCFDPIYGPVKSWRFGRSLGIDPIGPLATCSFNCIYCQLGNIPRRTIQRQIFVKTDQIQQALENWDPLVSLDVVTFSGSGEPTLALNLGEIIACTQEYLDVPVVVLTNGSLLGNRAVRADLKSADQVVVKLDAISDQQLQNVNRPVTDISITSIIDDIIQFSEEYSGELAIQTMLLAPWSSENRAHYIELIQEIFPDEVQLNVPSRPRMLTRQLEARGNNTRALESHEFQKLNCISTKTLRDFATQIETYVGISTSYPIIKTQNPRSRELYSEN